MVSSRKASQGDAVYDYVSCIGISLSLKLRAWPHKKKPASFYRTAEAQDVFLWVEPFTNDYGRNGERNSGAGVAPAHSEVEWVSVSLRRAGQHLVSSSKWGGHWRRVLGQDSESNRVGTTPHPSPVLVQNPPRRNSSDSLGRDRQQWRETKCRRTCVPRASVSAAAVA